MMNHSNLLDLKQTRLLWFHGVVSLLGFRRKSGLFFPGLFGTGSFPVPLATLPHLPFLLLTLSCSTWKLHGPLCVCVHVCACIYMYREIYMWGSGEGVESSSGLAARTLPSGARHLPSVLVRSGEWGWVPLLSSPQEVFLTLGQMVDSAAVFLRFLLHPYEREKRHFSLDDCSYEMPSCAASVVGRREEPAHFDQSSPPS